MEGILLQFFSLRSDLCEARLMADDSQRSLKDRCVKALNVCIIFSSEELATCHLFLTEDHN